MFMMEFGEQLFHGYSQLNYNLLYQQTWEPVYLVYLGTVIWTLNGTGCRHYWYISHGSLGILVIVLFWHLTALLI